MPLFGKEHVERYIATDGEDGHDWLGKALALLLTTTGRRSGVPRTVALRYGRDGDDYILAASNGGRAEPPAWYLNLADNPSVEVQLGADRFTAQARTATADERPRLWQIMTAVYPGYDDYTATTDRVIPVIILERR